MTPIGLDKHIEITPGIAGGRPRIAGHRIRVQDVAIWHVKMGQSVDEIVSEYDLTLADVHAALAYYFDHRDEIEKNIEDDDAFVEEMKRRTPSILLEKLEEMRRHGRAQD